MLAIVAFLRGADEIALSYAPTNTVARDMDESIGFSETGETEGDEIVARLKLRHRHDKRPQ